MSEHEEYKETWFIVPRSIVDLPDISLGFLKVFETIFQFWNKGRKCYLSNPEISKRTGLKITQVKEAIAYFERHKELERIQIGMKRYLMQPLKVVEIPGLEVVPKEVAALPATCTNDTQVAAPPARGGRSTGQEVAAPPATEIKKLNKEIKKDIPPISPKRGKSPFCLFSLENILKDNPHNLEESVIVEWEEIRVRKHKSPLTERAWKRNNKVLSELAQIGIKMDEAIDRMLSAEWRCLEVSYFEKEIKALKPSPLKYPTPDERAANEQKIREREIKAQQEKREEIEASKGFKDIVAKAKTKAERDAEWEEQRIKMGMTKMEFAAYVLNQARVSKDIV